MLTLLTYYQRFLIYKKQAAHPLQLSKCHKLNNNINTLLIKHTSPLVNKQLIA